jgi:hypothetical protein
MKDNIYSPYDLKKNNIDYCSFSMFYKEKACVSHCSNQEWLEFYQKEYSSVKIEPPVQEYLVNSNSSLIIWDFFTLGSKTSKYIDLRNKVSGSTNNTSVLIRKDGYLSVLTIGTNMNSPELFSFIDCRKDYLSDVLQDLFQKSVSY